MGIFDRFKTNGAAQSYDPKRSETFRIGEEEVILERGTRKNADEAIFTIHNVALDAVAPGFLNSAIRNALEKRNLSYRTEQGENYYTIAPRDSQSRPKKVTLEDVRQILTQLAQEIPTKESFQQKSGYVPDPIDPQTMTFMEHEISIRPVHSQTEYIVTLPWGAFPDSEKTRLKDILDEQLKAHDIAFNLLEVTDDGFKIGFSLHNHASTNTRAISNYTIMEALESTGRIAAQSPQEQPPAPSEPKLGGWQEKALQDKERVAQTAVNFAIEMLKEKFTNPDDPEIKELGNRAVKLVMQREVDIKAK